MATQQQATVARINPATWKPDRKAVNAPTWAWDNNAFSGWFWLEEMISNPQFDASKYTSTYDIAGKKYGILKATPAPTGNNLASNLPPADPNINVAWWATWTLQWTQNNDYIDLSRYTASASAVDQGIMNQLASMEKDYQTRADQYKADRDAAQRNSEWALDTTKIDNAYNEYKTQQDERRSNLLNTQTNLNQLNAQMQRDLVAIANKPILGAISRGQSVIKQQEYTPQITMLQGNAKILQDDIAGAQNEWNIYYKKEDDNRTALVNHYDKLFQLSDQGYLSLTKDEKDMALKQLDYLKGISDTEKENKDKIIALMAEDPTWFVKWGVLPTDTYEQALLKVSKYSSTKEDIGGGIYVSTPAERDALKAQGYIMKTVNGKTYASMPDLTSKVEDFDNGKYLVSYDKMGNVVKKTLLGGKSSSWSGSGSTVKLTAEEELFQKDLNASLSTLATDTNKWWEEWNYMQKRWNVPPETLDQLLNKSTLFPKTEEKKPWVASKIKWFFSDLWEASTF